MVDFPFQGFGLGLRREHYDDIFAGQARASWFEAISENFMGHRESGPGRPLELLLRVRQDFPVALHGVTLSIGGSEPLDKQYLKKWKRLIETVEPLWVSDHLCWGGVHGFVLHDLLPLPYTQETVNHVAERVQQVQDFLGRRILLENVSTYMEFSLSEMTEWEFVREVVTQADCGLLLDVNNIYVSAFNHDFDPINYLDGVPFDRVGQIHLAGPSDEGHYLFDTHDSPVLEPVWELYRETLKRAGPISTMIEWDDNIPPLKDLEMELDKARQIHSEVFSEKSKPVSRPQAFA